MGPPERGGLESNVDLLRRGAVVTLEEMIRMDEQKLSSHRSYYFANPKNGEEKVYL